MDRDFKLQTPWVFNASLGYTGRYNLGLGAEYEYEDYFSLKFNILEVIKWPGNRWRLTSV